jgi:hypothetical protein
MPFTPTLKVDDPSDFSKFLPPIERWLANLRSGCWVPGELEALRAAESLDDLQALTATATERENYATMLSAEAGYRVEVADSVGWRNDPRVRASLAYAHQQGAKNRTADLLNPPVTSLPVWDPRTPPARGQVDPLAGPPLRESPRPWTVSPDGSGLA